MRETIWTIPNGLTILRLLGAGVLPWLAWTDARPAFIGVFVAVVLTDWLDGKIAMIFHQRTILGARLDSAADAIVYAVLPLCTWWLEPEFVQTHLVGLSAVAVSYAMTSTVGLIRFGRWPSYHTRAAKTCWLLASVGAFFVFLGGPYWPCGIALWAVVVTNIEATVLSFVLPEWRADVPSLWHALRHRRGVDAGSASRPTP